MTAADQWRWTDDEGVQRLLSGEELRSALHDGRLQPSVLVWKRGMAKWLPAADVNELAQVIQNGRRSLHSHVPQFSEPPARAQQPSYPRARPSGGWSDGAARQDEDEPTVTNIRKEDIEQPADAKGGENPWVQTLPRARKAATLPSGGLPQGGGLQSTGLGRGFQDRSSPKRARSTATDTEVLGADGLPKKRGSRPPPPKPRRSTRPPPPRIRSRQATKKGHKQSSVPPPLRRNAPARQRGPSGVIPSVREPMPMQGTIRAASPSPAQRLGALEGSPRTSLGSQPGPLSAAHTAVSPGVSPKRGSIPPPAARPSPKPRQDSAPRAEQPSDGGRDSLSALKAGIPKAPRVPSLKGLVAEPSQSGQVDAQTRLSSPELSLFDDEAQARRQAAMMPTHIPPSLAERRGVTLPVPLLAAGGGGALLLLILSFIVGRVSAPAEAGMADAVRARTGWVAVPLFTRQQSDYGTPRPCLMARAPARIDRTASQRVPMELLPLNGNRVAIGFAATPTQGRGVIYNMMSASAEVAFEPEESEGLLSRVVPVATDDGARFEVSLKQNDDLRDSVIVPAEKPWSLAFKGNDVVLVDGGESATLWSAQPAGKPADSIRTVGTKSGFAVTFRNGLEVFGGELDPQGKNQVDAIKLGQTDGIMGRPSVGYNGRQVAITFAALAKGERGAELFLARGDAGKPLKEAEVLDLPPGGPGTSAIAPAIAGLSRGRWLLMWTEGGRGNRALRAQTYDSNFRTVGEALRVSPATGSFGQGTVTVVGERAIVGFLLRKRSGFELWSTVLQCQ